ncbi:hypothetical protein FK535_06975 [Mycolicibacterium sp. 018/SC-01/001]|uniref:hypothetical protein n=1 Tax=Mycolicibacterium sp. 018/SC-01/001 TaxID=2592069 RepID=UPI001181750E|nr:hypothetical protein [Mycolicibacterium sp. 018/SC-01/001]TRW86208.1 hypothetical protein FK535_06975 [Mycolicibacterium sp. 018/SC-01/001]
MSDVKTERRLEALTKWAHWASAQGYPVPSSAELADIAAEPTAWRDRITSVAAHAWGHTIDYVIKQQRFGVVSDEIVRSLSDEYVRPNGPIGATASAATEEVPVVARESAPPIQSHVAPDEAIAAQEVSVTDELVAWRERRIADGADGADLIKVTTLRNLVKFGYTDAETIGKKLPGQAAYLAREIAEIIARFDRSITSTTASNTPSSPPGVTPARTAPPPRPEASVTATPPSEHEHRNVPRAQVGLLHLTHDDFCEYRYVTPDSQRDTATPRQIKITPLEAGVRLSFEAFVPEAGKMVIYRVVAADGSPPRKPEAGDLVGATTALQVEDRRPLRTAVRSYQVWCHVGVDQDDAARNNPFLLAKGHEISPVSDFEIHITEGRISGEWTVFPGAHRVKVYRIPLDGVARIDDPQHEICRGQANVDGFADWDAEPGLRYLYRACAEIAIDGITQLSRPVEHEVTIPVTLTPVVDLSITPSAVESGRVDIVWTAPPIGRVKIYWADSRPRADVGQQRDLTQSRLSIVDGFREENRIHGPTERFGEDRARIAGVAFPPDWPRVYVTPVTVLGEEVRVGVTQVETRQLPPVSNAEIIERFDTEMVTFGWPAEAASVLVYVGGPTMAVDEIVQRNKPVDEIWQAKYERDGGVIFDKQLEAKGCTVVLVPVNYSQREAIPGEPTALHYAGLHRIYYQLVPQRNDPTRYLNELHLATDLEVDSSIALTMVNRRDRLPLSPSDGELVYFYSPDGDERLPQCLIQELKKGRHVTGWRADWTLQRGYFRLFLTSQADTTKRYALADPPVQTLFFSPDIPPPGAPQ